METAPPSGSSVLLPEEDDGLAASQQSRPPSPTALDHQALLALIQQGEFSHQTTLRALRLQPERLCSLPPPPATETPLHAVVRTGNLRLLEMLLAEHPSAIDLGVRDAQGRTVLEVARDGKAVHPRMIARVEGLMAYETEAHALAAGLSRGDEGDKDALVAALTRRLDWISAPHHKAWTVLHHVVHSGDVGLLERVVGIPGSWAAIKLRARTRDCKRTVVELAREGGVDSPMARYLREVRDLTATGAM